MMRYREARIFKFYAAKALHAQSLEYLNGTFDQSNLLGAFGLSFTSYYSTSVPSILTLPDWRVGEAEVRLAR